MGVIRLYQIYTTWSFKLPVINLVFGASTVDYNCANAIREKRGSGVVPWILIRLKLINLEN